MSTPRRELVLQDFGAALEAIAGMAKVERGIRTFAQVGEGERPYLGWSPEADEIEPACFLSELKHTLHVNVYGYVDTESAADRGLDLANLQRAVLRAVLADPTRGGNAMSTLPSSAEFGTDEADPNTADTSDGAFQLAFDIEYFTAPLGAEEDS